MSQIATSGSPSPTTHFGGPSAGATMMAASSGNHEAVRAMLHAGADVEIQNSNGHTALHMAELDNKMHRRDDSARLLREHAVERVDQGRVWYEAKNKKGFKTHRHTHSEL